MCVCVLIQEGQTEFESVHPGERVLAVGQMYRISVSKVLRVYTATICRYIHT